MPRVHRLPSEAGKWFQVGVPTALAAVGTYTLRAINPVTTWIFPPCLFRIATGYLCPGCGTVRALHQLLNGHLAVAFRLNPLAILLSPYVIYSGAGTLLRAAGGRRLPTVSMRPVAICILLAATILFWILRNLPQFTMLAGN